MLVSIASATRRSRKFGGSLVACALLIGVLLSRLGSDPALTLAAVGDPNAAMLAFITDRDGNNEIYVMQVPTREVRNVSNNPASDTFADWSPDGTKIVFESNRDGNPDVWVMDADGSNSNNLTSNPAADGVPSWSSDGEWIAFYSTRRGSLDVFAMRVDGSDVRRLTRPPYGGFPTDFTATGQYVLFHGTGSGPQLDIWRVPLSGGPAKRLTRDPALDADATSFQSGGRIAYWTEHWGAGDIVLLRRSTLGWRETRLTRGQHKEAWPHASPTERRLAFAADRFGSLDLFLIGTNGERRVRLTDDPAADWMPRWRPKTLSSG